MAPDEPAVVAWTISVDAASADATLALLLDAFPAGIVDERDATQATLTGYLPAGQEPALPAGVTATAVPVRPGWSTQWRAFHTGVVINRFWVGPPWRDPPTGHEPIVIEPAAAFGTGAHASTRAAALLLIQLEPPAGATGDIGCGSGVLAILAARLGHQPVWACDTDPLAIDAAADNAQRNQTSIDLLRSDALHDSLPAADLWIANIHHAVLEPLLKRPDRPPRILVSGLRVSERLTAPGLRAIEHLALEDWQAILFERA